MDAPYLPELAAVLAVWALAVVSPGPAFLVITQLAVGRSRAVALWASLGQALGAVFYAALTLWGFAVLVSQIAWLGTALRIAGAIYLVYLGLSIFHAASRPPSNEAPPAPRATDAAAAFGIGLLTALTNPKAIAFFLSLFAVMLPAHLPLAGKATLLCAGFAMELAWYVVVSLALSTGGLQRLYRRARAPIEKLLGAVLLLLGVRIGVER